MMQRLGQYVSTAIGLVILAAALYGAWPAVLAWAQTTGSWPVSTVTTISGASAVQIVGANPSRRALQICNASASPNHVWIGPTNPSGVTAATPAANSGYFLSAVPTTAFTSVFQMSCYSPPVTNGLGAAWQAISPTSSATILVWEY